MHTRKFHEEVFNKLNNVVNRMTEKSYGAKAIRSVLRRTLRNIGMELLK